MERFFCLAIVIAFCATSNEAINCQNNKCTAGGSQQTLCKYPNPNPASSCGRVFSVGFTDAEKREILNKHNELRSYVAAGKEKRGNPGPQPPAANMKTMVWDDAIAEVAQRWTNQCHFGHDQCRDDDRFYVGQNAAITMSSPTIPNTKPADIAEMWYNEVAKFDRNQVSGLTNNIGAVGHYTQLVWANSDRLGCGKIVYQEPGDTWIKYFVVCNYGPGGNIIGQPLYQIRH